MTTINTSSLSLYSSTFTTGLRTDEPAKNESGTVDVNLRGSVYKTAEADGAGKGEATASSPLEQAIKQLQEQIKETQKRLQELQQQLAAAQASKGDEHIKAQQVMAIQQQISGAMAQLGAQTAALLEMMKGTINTTA